MDKVFADIRAERERQDAKWGPQYHNPLEWLSVLTEEVGELAAEVNTLHWHGGDWAKYRAELTQVAAVAAAALECLDKQEVRDATP